MLQFWTLVKLIAVRFSLLDKAKKNSKYFFLDNFFSEDIAELMS